MKNIIRKWLGITSIEEQIRHRTEPTEEKLRRIAGDAMLAALNGAKDEDWSPWGFSIETKNTITRALENASFESSSKQAKWEVQNIIGNEAFIDKVIERIKRKQLSD